VYPARIGPVNAVGAIDWNGNRALFAGGCDNGTGGSNWGVELTYVAPGEDVITCDRTGASGYNLGDYDCIDGTSFSSPYAAGVAALLISRDWTLAAADVEAILALSASDLGPVGYDTSFGFGAVDARAALDLVDGWHSVPYCTAGISSSGCVAGMSSVGAPSVAAGSGFFLVASGVEGQKLGVIFYGISGRHALPWAAGSTSFLCVKSPTQRTPAQQSQGNAGACNGSFVIDWLAYMGAHPTALGQPIVAGVQVNAQAWYRDPPAPKTTNLSDAIEFFVKP
jgi:hypothetical protein